MSSYKNISHVEPTIIGSQIKLSIHLNFLIDYEYKSCFNDALLKMGTHVSIRGSGAPTLENVTFEGFYVDTLLFPNNDFANKEAKEFLLELDTFLSNVIKLHDVILENRRKEQKRKMEEEKKAEEQRKKLFDFFNN